MFLSTILAAILCITSTVAQGTTGTLSASTYVNSHNTARSKWNAKALTAITDSAFLKSTQDWANACQFQHSSPNGAYGENLYASGSTNSQIPINFQEAMNSWMSESSAYCANGVAGPGQPQTGHFTQVVWKATTSVACAVARCPPQTIFKDPSVNYYANFYVCRYKPPGNYQGRYTAQVDTTNC